jgi:hypothetical protein
MMERILVYFGPRRLPVWLARGCRTSWRSSSGGIVGVSSREESDGGAGAASVV